jgi:hypothetical protein
MTEQPRPCGNYHALPCGLDRLCPVPVKYHDGEKTSQEIWDEYERE